MDCVGYGRYIANWGGIGGGGEGIRVHSFSAEILKAQKEC